MRSITLPCVGISRYFEVVQLLHENQTEECTTDAMNGAAANHHLGILQFLHTHRSGGCTTDAMDQAAKRGWMETLELLRQHRTEGRTSAAATGALGKGPLGVLQWLWAWYPHVFQLEYLLQEAKWDGFGEDRATAYEFPCRLFHH